VDNQNPKHLYDGDYSYADSGLDAFMSRSVDGISAPNLDRMILNMPLWARQLPYDTMQTSGSLGDTLSVGNIAIDGVTGRISVFDGDNNEVVRIGTL
jgi:hypothetical protein